jgi:hypothetical protein
MSKRFALVLVTLLALLAPAFSLAQRSTTLPPNYKTVLENSTFRIIRVHYGPHEKVPVHDHPDTPTVYVYLNNSGPIRIIHEEKDGTQSTLVRPPTHTGAFRVSPGMIERHSIENPGDIESDFLRVELPHLRLGDKTLEFRGPAPASLDHNLSATEFTSPRLSIRRILCVDQSPCTIQPAPGSSVIVAFSPTTIATNGQTTKLGLGDVMAIAPHQTLQLSPTGAEPVHVLEVLVHNAPAKP